jgi:hypothetical protein
MKQVKSSLVDWMKTSSFHPSWYIFITFRRLSRRMIFLFLDPGGLPLRPFLNAGSGDMVRGSDDTSPPSLPSSCFHISVHPLRPSVMKVLAEKAERLSSIKNHGESVTCLVASNMH